MRRHQYFRHGIPITEADALVNGVLRDGCTVRVPAFFRDSAAATHHRVTDAKGDTDTTAGNRPGWRITVDAAARDAREAARREYLDYITNAYKQPQRVRDVDHDEPTHFSRPRITDGTGNCSELAFSRPGWRMVADASVNDARETAYAEYLDDLTNAWRSKPPRV